MSPGVRKEYGESRIETKKGCPLFDGIEEPAQTVLRSHGDSVDILAPGFLVAARSGNVIAAIFNEAGNNNMKAFRSVLMENVRDQWQIQHCKSIHRQYRQFGSRAEHGTV